MIKTINIKEISCNCIPNNESTRIVYMIYPALHVFKEDWLETQARKNKCSLVMVYVPIDKWNDYLTPWPEPGETPGAQSFAGEGAKFLKTLQEDIIPQTEKVLGMNIATERDLVGVSLGGLFTLWQWMQSSTFRSIACLSGSFWYNGFMEWFSRQTIPHKQGKAYILLGTEEPKAFIKAYRTVGVNTENIVGDLKKAGIAVTFDWVPGNHFANPLQRAEKALVYLGAVSK